MEKEEGDGEERGAIKREHLASREGNAQEKGVKRK